MAVKGFFVAVLAALILSFGASASSVYPDGTTWKLAMVWENQQSPFCDPDGDGSFDDSPQTSSALAYVTLVDRPSATFELRLTRTRVAGTTTRIDFHNGLYVNEGVYASVPLDGALTVTARFSSPAMLADLEDGVGGIPTEQDVYANVHTTLCTLGEVADQFPVRTS